jgi:hypothetical protein
MDHLDDSLSSDRLPLKSGSPLQKQLFDKYRPVDPNLKKLNEERQLMDAKLAKSMFNE